MQDLANKKVAVIGLDASGVAACTLLQRASAEIFAIPGRPGEPSQKETATLKSQHIKVSSEKELPPDLDLCVHSSGISRKGALVSIGNHNCELISDLELASRGFCCLSVAITGTNGKTTTAELVAAMLAGAQRKTVRAGASGAPVCSVVEETRELDFVTLDLNSFQLESVVHFRPSVAVVTNIRGDHMDKYSNLGEYAQAIGCVFRNQQVFDWAILESEALAHLRSLNVSIPSKIVTFSATHRKADIFLDRGLLISSLPNWSGPLLNMDQCALRGPHNAENVMAALAVGRVLRVPLEQMIAAIKEYRPGPHRLELVCEVGGIKFVDNSKAMNVSAVQQSIEAIPLGRAGEPNIWLIAGGVDKGLHYHDLGPLLASRVKGAFLLGEAREKLRAAWSLFTPCAVVETLLEAVSKAAENAVAGDIVLLSPACSSFDMFQNYQHRGEVFRQAVQQVTKSANFDSTLATARASSEE